MRSGIHCVAGWLMSNLGSSITFANNITNPAKWRSSILSKDDTRIGELATRLATDSAIILKTFESKPLGFNTETKPGEWNVLVVRNPVCVISSMIQYLEKGGKCKDIVTDARFDALWIEHAREACGRTSQLHNLTVIVYDRFIQCPPYRVGILKRLSIEPTSDAIPTLLMGGGSSYTGPQSSTVTQLLNRYQHHNTDVQRVEQCLSINALIPELFKNTIRFGILVPTYRRPHERTMKYIVRLAACLKAQTYSNFVIYLAGDHYDDDDEFQTIAKMLSFVEVVAINTSHSYRQGYFKRKLNKWTCGGQYAKMVATQRMVDDGIRYYLHLDDDDLWEPEHVKVIHDTIMHYNQVGFTICQAHYKKGFLPREADQLCNTGYNNFAVQRANSVHSSWCIDLNRFGTRLLAMYKERVALIESVRAQSKVEDLIMPFDGAILKALQKMQKTGDIKCIYIDKCTVTKESDVNVPV